MRRFVAVVALLVAASACGGDDPEPGATTSAAPATASTAPTARVKAVPCAKKSLGVALGEGGGAGGTFYMRLAISNTGKVPCTVKQPLRLELVDAGGKVLGKRATATDTAAVRIEAGGSASWRVGFPEASNFDDGSDCSKEASAMFVYLAGEPTGFLVPVDRPWCPGFNVEPI